MMHSRLFLFSKYTFYGILALGVLSYGLFSHSAVVLAITDAEQDAIWRAELAQTEADIAKWQGILNSTKANTKSKTSE